MTKFPNRGAAPVNGSVTSIKTGSWLKFSTVSVKVCTNEPSAAVTGAPVASFAIPMLASGMIGKLYSVASVPPGKLIALICVLVAVPLSLPGCAAPSVPGTGEPPRVTTYVPSGKRSNRYSPVTGSVVTVRLIVEPSIAIPVKVITTPSTPKSLPSSTPSFMKSKNTLPAIEEAMTDTVPVSELLVLTSSKEDVVAEAVLLNTWPDVVIEVTRAGTVTVRFVPRSIVPKSQVKEPAPTAPVQVVLVALPALTATVIGPAISIFAGRLSVSSTSSISARPAAVRFSTSISQSNTSKMLTVDGIASLRVTARSPRLRIVVFSVLVLLPARRSKSVLGESGSISSESISTKLFTVPFDRASKVMSMVSLSPAAR